MRCAILLLLACGLSAQAPKQTQAVTPVRENKKPNKNSPNSSINGGPVSEPLKRVGPAPSGDEKTTKDDDDAEANRRIADYTEKLANYTMALVGVGIAQILALAVQGFFLRLALQDTSGL